MEDREKQLLYTMLSQDLEYFREENSRLIEIIRVMSGAADGDVETLRAFLGKPED